MWFLERNCDIFDSALRLMMPCSSKFRKAFHSRASAFGQLRTFRRLVKAAAIHRERIDELLPTCG